MDLDAVRELKERAIKTVVQPLVEARVAAVTLAYAATDVRATRAVPPQRVMALGISRADNGGYRLAVRLQRQSFLGGPELDRLTKMAKGEIDVRFVGRVEKRVATPWQRTRQRPLLIGSSIGHYRVTAGTLGAFVRRIDDAHTLHVLSNNHVLANENQAQRGDAIIQPGRFDGGTRSTDRVGSLSRFVRLKRRHNLVDCAIAELDAGARGAELRKLKGIGALRGVSPDLDVGMRVRKIGRTTGVTTGRITAIEVDDVVVAFSMGNISFEGQIEIEGEGNAPFSDGGDSGSLIVDAQRRAVGLLFAGSESGGANNLGLTYANPIQAVLDALRVELPS